MTAQNITRYVRYESGGQTSYGILEGETIRQLSGPPYGGAQPTGQSVQRSSVNLLLPIDPDIISKVVAVVDNYAPPGTQMAGPGTPGGLFVPHPFLSPKMQTSLSTSGTPIEILPEGDSIGHHGCMVVVIGKEGRNIEIGDAEQYILGVAVGNDVTVAGWMNRAGGINTPDRILAKSPDTYGPMGYEIVSGLNINNLNLETKVNGQVAASGNTSSMVTSVAKLIHYYSHYCTLLPGDLIFTDGPVPNEGMAGLKAGDTVEVTLEGVGTVSNPVINMPENGINRWWEQMAQANLAAARR
jgi:2-keto-4-pentenoate hydratase/2-oxohepta-3-ene-1,7-dioic acid hydratase in catechol pathway